MQYDTSKPMYRVHRRQRNVAKFDMSRSFEVPTWNECKFWLELYDSQYIVEEFNYDGELFVGDTLYGLQPEENVGDSNE